MKKILSVLVVSLMVTTGVKADEGMWLLTLVEKMNIASMSELGCKLSAEDIYSINHSSIKDAIVHFGGGCTGEIISSEGLLITNHHCGYGGIQKLSTPEHNYLEDGYWAKNRSEELPVPGLTVTFLQYMNDVTAALDKARQTTLKENKNSDNAEEIAQKAVVEETNRIVKEVEEKMPGCKAMVRNFYNNNVFYLIVYKTYRDIRFVGAPPVSVGKFGGEADNWEWPRHTGDFSMFRVYAGKDNEPADYSTENVPYVPLQALKVSLKGVEDGDFSFIMGYPGSTQRFQTASQLQSMIDVNNVRVAARTCRQDVMVAGMEADPVVRLQYASKYAGSANGWKKWQGEDLAFKKLNIIGREKQKESDFSAWVSASKKRVEKYGSALNDINEAIAVSAQARKDIALVMETLSKIGPLSIYSAFSRAKEANDEAIDAAAALFRDYNDPLERRMAVALLDFYRQNARKELYPDLGCDFATMDFQKYVDEMFDKSAFTSADKMQALKGKTKDEINNDPVAEFQKIVTGLLTPLMAQTSNSQKQLQKGSKAFGAGLMEWKAGEPSYPDANSTMRLTYGSVKSYSPKDGIIYKHYTTIDGIMEKENPDDYEFIVPAKLKELWKEKDYGQYANADGTVPVCFLTNNDITGGNSGSPVLNAEGALIGLAFDGNWESMSSDVLFEPELQRCICVDIRYVLFLVDKFGGAGYLLEEMDIVR